MKTSTPAWAEKRLLASASLVVVLLVSCATGAPTEAHRLRGTRLEMDQLVDRGAMTLNDFLDDKNMGTFRDLLKSAKGVFIVPQVLRGAVIFGAFGGNGVLLVRDPKNGQWLGPAFYSMGGASVGLQLGGESSEMVLLLMTDRGVASFLTDSLKIGADVGVAAGPVGIGGSASTANLSADVLAFSRSTGLYGGLSLEGAVVISRHEWNKTYYGASLTPIEILIRRDAVNPQSYSLRDEVAKSACTSGDC
jgi:lipid-binding SYLF domain-containing protein